MSRILSWINGGALPQAGFDVIPFDVAGGGRVLECRQHPDSD